MAGEVKKDEKKEAPKAGKAVHKPREAAKPAKEIQKVRILSTDIDGSKNLITGISRVKGVGRNMANAIVRKLGMDQRRKLLDLNETEIETIEKAINDPASLGVSSWMFNRRKDMEKGKDIHVNTVDLTVAVKLDKDLMGEIKSYKGLRHARGLKVRGQRTASTGRGHTVVGVKRKKTA